MPGAGHETGAPLGAPVGRYGRSGYLVAERVIKAVVVADVEVVRGVGDGDDWRVAGYRDASPEAARRGAKAVIAVKVLLADIME